MKAHFIFLRFAPRTKSILTQLLLLKSGYGYANNATILNLRTKKRILLKQSKYYIAVLRLDHWHKNLFTLLGSLGAIAYFHIPLPKIDWRGIVLGFFLSCLLSSVNYVINEFLDASFDALHPTKRQRPIPSGKINPEKLFFIAGLMLVAAILISDLWMPKFFSLFLILFFLSGLLYNLRPVRAKDIAFLDVIVESLNNPIRLCMGWYAFEHVSKFPPLSLIICFWVFGAYLMTAKRYAEIQKISKTEAEKYRPVYRIYTSNSLIRIMHVYALLTLFTFTWISIRYKPAFLYFLPFAIVFFIWFYILTIQKDSFVSNPEKIYINKPFLIFCVISLVFLIILGVYG